MEGFGGKGRIAHPAEPPFRIVRAMLGDGIPPESLGGYSNRDGRKEKFSLKIVLF